MGKWGSFQESVERLHADFSFPEVVFLNHTKTGVEDGQPTGSYNEIGSLDCEFVPPAADSTVDTEGTHLDFSTSIRVPADDLAELSESIVGYGEDGEKPTRAIPQVDVSVTYEVSAPIVEHGSDMRLLRLREV